MARGFSCRTSAPRGSDPIDGAESPRKRPRPHDLAEGHDTKRPTAGTTITHTATYAHCRDLPMDIFTTRKRCPRRRARSTRSTSRRTSSSRSPGRRPTKEADRCWNCQSTNHRYSDCLEPRGNTYCYGYGQDGVTMRTCPRCGPEWLNLGPYHPENGHLGKPRP